MVNNLDYAKNRYYDPARGRFTTPDPAASGEISRPGSWNRYAYTEGDPINFNDPGGLWIQYAGGGSGNDYGGTFWPGAGSGGAASFWGGTFSPHLRAMLTPEEGVGGGGETALSQDCLNALKVTGKDAGAVKRALNAVGTLQEAVKGTGIDWTMLAAVGVRESGFQNLSEKDGAGVGVGVFQITVNANSGVTAKQAGDLTWASTWAASLLGKNLLTLSKNFQNFSLDELLQATAASYNVGTSQISGNPKTIDVGTAGGNFGSNILDLMKCFH